MRTIVINTSDRAKDTKLNILFEAPFDQSSLLWFDTVDLLKLNDYPELIKKALIDDSDTVDKNYNLIVLVDIYTLSRGNEKDFAKIYKALLTKYILSKLVDPLKTEYEIAPISVAVFFVDSLKKTQSKYNFSNDNPRQAESEKQQKILEQEKKDKIVNKDENGDLIDDNCTCSTYDSSLTSFQRSIADVFSWKDSYKKSQIIWDKTLIEGLDFGDVFENAVKSIDSSDDNVPVIKIAIIEVENLINSLKLEDYSDKDVKKTNMNTCNPNGIKLSILSFDIITENKQGELEGYFNVFVNIFLCIHNSQIIERIIHYKKEEIRGLLIEALKKYTYFSEEKNIELNLEPVTELFEKRDDIYKKRKQTALDEITEKDIKALVDDIMKITDADSKMDVDEVLKQISRPNDMDKRFGKIATEIFNNYNASTIKKQNDAVVRERLEKFWNWRDRQTESIFIDLVNTCLDKQQNNSESPNGNEQVSDNHKTDMFIINEDLENEYTRLVNDVTETEHKLVANENILLETKNMIVKYMDVAQKGRRHLIAGIGALVAIIISIFPYISVQSASLNENIIHKILYIFFTAGFVVLYGLAVDTYTRRIKNKKRALINELEQYKENSEKERRESIEMLIKYYTDTIVDAESHYLLKREILRRNERNSRKLMMRNNHIVRLNHLERKVKHFITNLKLNYGDGDIQNDTNVFEKNGVKLHVEKSCYDAENRLVYSILDPNKCEDVRKEENK